MRDASQYIFQLEKLARLLYDKPELKKPDIGPIHDFDSPATDPLLREIKKLSSQIKESKRLDAIVNSSAGVGLAEQEVKRLYQLIQAKAKIYTDQTDLRFIVETNPPNSLLVKSTLHAVVFNWEPFYSNTTDKALLHVAQWKGPATFNRSAVFHPRQQPQRLTEQEYSFALDTNERPVWVSNENRYTSEDLIQVAFSYIMEKLKLDADLDNES
jgi:hypothetical protein